MDGPNKLQCLSLASISSQVKEHSSFMSSYTSNKKIKCEYGYMGRIHKTSFSLSLMNRPNKLECHNTLAFKDFPKTNTLAY